MTIGKRLQQLRDAAGLSQAALAARAGVPVSSLRNYEQGLRVPTLVPTLRLLRALAVGVEEFDGCDELANGKAKRGRKA